MGADRRLAAVAAAVALASIRPSVHAQEQGAISAGYERSYDRFHYRFENPSTFDTAALVPHEFTQTYWGDNQWIVVRAAFRVLGRPLETEAAATPQRATRADDFDTFFQPSGDVVIAGTTGGASMRAWRIRQAFGLGRTRGVDWSLAYRYRADRTDFRPGLKSVSHTAPPSYDAFVIATRETTVSRNFGPELRVARVWSLRRLRTDAGATIAPVTVNRLTIALPDKYPAPVVFSGLGAMLAPRLRIEIGNRWLVAFTAEYQHTFNYSRSRQFVRNAASVGVGIGWRGSR